MAEGKTSPRQKMIGMMYLVLTALLALQVSSAVILKFQVLNERIEETVKKVSTENKLALDYFIQSVETRGNQPEEVKRKNLALETRKRTSILVNYIEKLKKDLIKQSGGVNERGLPEKPKEETVVEVIMIGSSKKGEAYKLKKELNRYVEFINKTSGSAYKKLAFDGLDDPFFKMDEGQNKKDFASLQFGQTPVAAGLATLSEFQSEILKMENNYLNHLNGDVGKNQFKVDKLYPIVNTSSSVIVAGLEYEANLMLGASSKTLGQKAELNGEALNVGSDGVCKVKFKTTGGNYDVNNRLEKIWTGKIHATLPNGKDTTYVIEQKYTVVKPAIQYNSQSVQALYKNCGNKMTIAVPALGDNYNPTITASAGDVIKGAGIGNVTIVPNPNSRNIVIKVSNNGTYIGAQKFKVKPIPLPIVKAKLRGSYYNEVNGAKATSIRDLKLVVVPNKDFQTELPQECQYKITKWKVLLGRGNRQIDFKNVTNRQSVNLASWIPQVNNGTRLIIEVIEMKRKNFRGQWEIVPYKPIFPISLYKD